jgi:chemotaxis protein methyltransferase CheR
MIGTPQLEQLRELIARRLGLQFSDSKLSFLAEVLRRRSDAVGCGATTYLARLASAGSEEIGALAQELTIGETYFFRNNDQFRALAQVAIPERVRAQTASRRLRVLSAGCASGEEPYTIAMVVRDTIPDPSWDVSIRAIDVNPAALDRARRARFTSWALRETPPHVQHASFRADGRDFVLDGSIRTMVRFEERNLAMEDPELWQPRSYDVIFCRNVLMYFTAEQMRTVIARMARSLAPCGYLFLGHAETLRGVSNEFHLCHTHETFYYQLRSETERIAELPSREPRVAEPQTRELAAVVATSDSWVAAIQQASDRIRALTGAHSTASLPDQRASWDLGAALDLLRRERFAEALELIEELPESSAHDPDVLLLHGVLLVHDGQRAAAEEVCGRLLALDELNAGAHYVLALCRESAGDGDGAIKHDQIATYLDPAFAMPRLHLGLVARRAGERDTARRELEQAIALLEREDASRLLLFGGGFHRDALIAVCRAELAKVHT